MTRSDVVEAADRIGDLVEHTPLIESEIRGDRVWLKCECLQTGSAFKLRGATNRLLQLSPEERERGVVAFSSGNHVLKAIGLSARDCRSSIRIGFGRYTTEEELLSAIGRINEAAETQERFAA